MFYRKEKRDFYKFLRGKIESIFLDRMFYRKEKRDFFLNFLRGKNCANIP